MAEADVIIAWGHGPVPESVKGAFQRPTKFLTLPNPNWKEPLAAFLSPSPVRAILAKYAPGTTPTRVATLGFSASCQGVGALLGSIDGGRIEAAVAVDGIHTGKPVSLSGMMPWLDFTKLAFLNDRLFVVTHSAVVPGKYASTILKTRGAFATLHEGVASDFRLYSRRGGAERARSD